MQTPKKASIGLIAGLALLYMAWAVYGQKSPSTKPITWEYKSTVTLSDAQMNELGAEGWELIMANTQSNSNLLIFKRQK